MDLGFGGPGKSKPSHRWSIVEADAVRSSVKGLPKRFPSRYTPVSEERVLSSVGHGPAKKLRAGYSELDDTAHALSRTVDHVPLEAKLHQIGQVSEARYRAAFDGIREVQVLE